MAACRVLHPELENVERITDPLLSNKVENSGALVYNINKMQRKSQGDLQQKKVNPITLNKSEYIAGENSTKQEMINDIEMEVAFKDNGWKTLEKKGRGNNNTTNLGKGSTYQ